MRRLSLAAMLLQFALTAWLYSRFDPAVEGLQFETRLPWIAAWGVYYQIGLDGYNLLLVLLTAFLGPLVVAGAFTAINKDVKLFYAMVFALQFAMLGTFLAQDLFLFYLFWEAMLIPLFLIIGIWGGERRIYATFKFVLYTAFGSILMLAAVIYLVYSLNATTGVTSFAFADLYRSELPLPVQTVLLAAFALSFAIKVPIVPLHTWLPDAHVEAPTAGSVILAGVLLKMGTYGFMKLAFPLFPDATRLLAPVFGTLAVVSIIYGACLALVQTDIKKIIAYSSISHLGYVMLGLISLDLLGIQGAIMQMVSHGLVAGGLFLMVGMVYERCHTRDLAAYGGLAKLLPVYSVFFMVLTLAAIGLPTTSGFTGEFLVLLGAFRAAWPQYVQGAAYPLIVSASAVAGVVLGALYMLWFAQRFLFGAAKAPHQPLVDLNLREKAILASIVVAVFALGLFPDEPMRKTELAARQYQQLVAGERTASPVATLQPDRPSPPVPQCPATPQHISRCAMNWIDSAIAMLPETSLLAGIVASSRSRSPRRVRKQGTLLLSLLAVILAAAAAVWLAANGFAFAAFAGHYSVDPPALLAKAIILALAVLVLLIARDDSAQRAFPILLLSSLYGVCLLLSSDSFLTLFLGLELMSLPVYALVLLAFRRPESAEAALKYLVLGGTATATLLMGVSLLYGSTGSLALSDVRRRAGLARRHGQRRRRAGGRRVLPQSGDRSVPHLGAGRIRSRGGPGDRVHGHDHQGGCAACRRAPVRQCAVVAADGRPTRDPAAPFDRLGQSGGDAAAELPPHDRLFVHRPRGIPLLRLPWRRPRPFPGRCLLRPGLRADECARFRSATAEPRRRGPRPPGQPQRPVPPRSVRRADDRRRHAFAGGHSAVPGVRRQVPDLQERHCGRVHALRGPGPGRQLPRNLLLSARHPIPLHEHGGADRRSGSARTPGAGGELICLLAAILLAVFPGWVIDLL